MKYGVKQYYTPTPIKLRKLGDALLGISTLGVPAILMEYKWSGICIFLIGVIGKFLTNFYGDDCLRQDPTGNNEQQDQ